MGRFATTADALGYCCEVEVHYTWSPIIPASMSGPEEGGIELDFLQVLSATDDDGNTASVERFEELEMALDLRQLYAEACAHYEDACEAAKELWAELRAEMMSTKHVRTR